jgi:hypothetical protein
MLCGLVVLALVASKDILLYQCIHPGLSVMIQNKLKRFVFAGMPGYRRIMASLDDFGMEFLVIGNVQFFFIVQESVKLFSLKKVVNQSARAFFAEYFEGLGDFNFAIRAISNLLFEFRRFGKDGGSKRGEAKGVKDQLILIVFSICDLKAYQARERISNTVFLAWLVN